MDVNTDDKLVTLSIVSRQVKSEDKYVCTCVCMCMRVWVCAHEAIIVWKDSFSFQRNVTIISLSRQKIMLHFTCTECIEIPPMLVNRGI